MKLSSDFGVCVSFEPLSNGGSELSELASRQQGLRGGPRRTANHFGSSSCCAINRRYCIINQTGMACLTPTPTGIEETSPHANTCPVARKTISFTRCRWNQPNWPSSHAVGCHARPRSTHNETGSIAKTSLRRFFKGLTGRSW